jgi:hypothetical protein
MQPGGPMRRCLGGVILGVVAFSAGCGGALPTRAVTFQSNGSSTDQAARDAARANPLLADPDPVPLSAWPWSTAAAQGPEGQGPER